MQLHRLKTRELKNTIDAAATLSSSKMGVAHSAEQTGTRRPLQARAKTYLSSVAALWQHSAAVFSAKIARRHVGILRCVTEWVLRLSVVRRVLHHRTSTAGHGTAKHENRSTSPVCCVFPFVEKGLQSINNRSQSLTASTLLLNPAHWHQGGAATVLFSVGKKIQHEECRAVVAAPNVTKRLLQRAESSRGTFGWAIMDIDAGGTITAARLSRLAVQRLPMEAERIGTPAHSGWRQQDSPSCTSSAHPRGLRWVQCTLPSRDNPEQQETKHAAALFCCCQAPNTHVDAARQGATVVNEVYQMFGRQDRNACAGPRCANWSEEPNTGLSLSIHESSALWVKETEVTSEDQQLANPGNSDCHDGSSFCTRFFFFSTPTKNEIASNCKMSWWKEARLTNIVRQPSAKKGEGRTTVASQRRDDSWHEMQRALCRWTPRCFPHSLVLGETRDLPEIRGGATPMEAIMATVGWHVFWSRATAKSCCNRFQKCW